MYANLIILTGFVTKASRFWYRGGDLKELLMPEKDYRKVVPQEQPAPIPIPKLRDKFSHKLA